MPAGLGKESGLPGCHALPGSALYNSAMTLHPGSPAPDFSGLSDDGQAVSLTDLRGQWTVLFFYPRAGSTHCTLEVRRFQRAMPEFSRLGVQVIGVSTDPPGDQAYFRSSCVLSFPLLSDGERIGEAFGVLAPSPFEDEPTSTRRVTRQTFLIAPDGMVARHWQVADPATHADEVLREVGALRGTGG